MTPEPAQLRRALGPDRRFRPPGVVGEDSMGTVSRDRGDA
jgi:hypothetical protein